MQGLGELAMLQSGQFSRWRFLVSVLIIGHLWALLGRPIEFATQGPTGTSPAAMAFYAPVRGYSEFTYLNHGYAFFAPDPGPSHLIRATLVDESGQREVLLYPDLRQQWPRLLYHRHFMLTEFLHNTFQPPRPAGELDLDPQVAQRWQSDRQRYEAIRQGYVEHLQARFGVPRVELKRVEHQLVGLPEYLAGQRQLDAPELYIELVDEPEADVPRWPRFGLPPGGLGQLGGER